MTLPAYARAWSWALLPIIDFGQERAYAPHGWYQWLSYA